MIRRRTILAIIITIVTVVVTNNFWLVFEPMPVDFDIKGNGNCYIEVQLNKKDNDDFDRIKTDEKDLDLAQVKHLNFSVKRSRYPKRMRIVLTKLKNNSPIEIKNINLGNGKYKLDDLSQFTCENGELLVKNNTLFIYPKVKSHKDRLNLVYKKTLDTKACVNFEFEVLVIIMLLTFLLAYKLSNYIADFKTEKQKSRVDIIFLSIFFAFLFVPMCRISQDEVTLEENRTLAKWNPFINSDMKINFRFGNDFNAWFNDRFNKRESFIYLHDYIFLKDKWFVKNVIKSKDGWLFYGDKTSVTNYINNIMFTDAQLKQINNYLVEIDDYCKKHNKKFYFVITPDKSKIYGEFYTDNIKKISEKSKTEQLIEYINKNSEIKLIYPRQRLLSEKKQGLIYYKDDTHWTLMGAYYGYLELMNVLTKDFPALDEYKITEYTTKKHKGDLYKMLTGGIRKYEDINYVVPDLIDYEYCNEPEKDEIVNCSNPSGKYNLLMFRDSFTCDLLQYLSHSFNKSKYVWTYNVSPSQLDDADVIVLEVLERFLPNLLESHME